MIPAFWLEFQLFFLVSEDGCNGSKMVRRACDNGAGRDRRVQRTPVQSLLSKPRRKVSLEFPKSASQEAEMKVKLIRVLVLLQQMI